MKILAVIPARAGSKGIPNKNIRLVGEHPMIYYAITNALQSSYITDVVVSTDSPEIQIIATQMGVPCHLRDEQLCQDDTTLDAVIYDAVPKNLVWDYIITLQPTSPTLTVETLDQAINYAIENKLDTLISTVNKPHLSWKEDCGKKFPAYDKRLNRQYLPPYYMETGAFVISKASVVTEQSRIGKTVDVFELDDKEALDIDTFADLQCASTVLSEQCVGIYVNGNTRRGMGHVYRALEIADEFYCKPDIIYDINQTNSNIFGQTTHTLVPVNGIAELFERCKTKKYSIFINDILDTSIDYMIGLRTVLPNAKIINFEDEGEGILKADLVFNALYDESDSAHVYSGEKYYIPGKVFLFYKPIPIRESVKKVFISFGGADPQNYTERLLNIILKRPYEGYIFTIAIGRAKQNAKQLLEYNQYANINIVYDVKNMPELMSDCDIAVTSRGRTGYELALMGIPTIAMSQNKREEHHSFICNENGFDYIGLNPSDEIIEGNLKMYLTLSQKSREELQEKLLMHNLRNGRKRVMNLIHTI